MEIEGNVATALALAEIEQESQRNEGEVQPIVQVSRHL
jgi:hypothetical protein